MQKRDLCDHEGARAHVPLALLVCLAAPRDAGQGGDAVAEDRRARLSRGDPISQPFFSSPIPPSASFATSMPATTYTPGRAASIAFRISDAGGG